MTIILNIFKWYISVDILYKGINVLSSLTTEKRHSFSLKFDPNLSFVIIIVFTWLLFIIFIIIFFNFINQKIPLLLFLTFDNFILTFYLHSLSGKLSFVVFEASLQIICLFLSSEIILFVLLPHFYLNFYQELSDCYIHSKLCLLYHYYPLELMIP